MPLMIKDIATNIDRALRLMRIINYSPSSSLGPLCVDVSLTSHCNHQCYFCDTHSYLRHQETTFEKLPTKVIRDLFTSCVALGVREILLAGNGEPFIVNELPDLLDEFGKRIKFKILTNGSLMNRKSLREICSNLYKLTISVNAIDRETHRMIHGYKGPSQLPAILDGIDTLLDIPDTRKKLQINYVLTKDNLDEFRDVIDYSHRKNLFFAIRPMAVGFKELHEKAIDDQDLGKVIGTIDSLLAGSKMNHYARYTLQFAKDSCRVATERMEQSDTLLPCYTGFYWGFINSNGVYRICCHCDSELGNIKERSFMDIWEDPSTQEHIYTTALMHELGKPVCGKCYGCVDTHTYSALFHRYVMSLPFQRRILKYRWKMNNPALSRELVRG